MPESPPKRKRPGRLRRFFLRHLPIAAACGVILLCMALIGIYLAASSSWFEELARRELVARLEAATGGRVEIASFHWNLLHLEAEAEGVVIHGLEAPQEAPYARVARLRASVSVFGLWSPRILLRNLEIMRPQLHLIAYVDGSTNQPQPRRPSKAGKPALERLFDLKAGKISVEQGLLDYDDRASDFDFLERRIPFDFSASDLTVSMAYEPALRGKAESYRIEAGASGLRVVRGASGRRTEQKAEGRLEAAFELTRGSAQLQRLRFTANRHTVEMTGLLEDFANPRWQAKIQGELDLRIVEAVTGYPSAPEGIAHLALEGEGEKGLFRVDGNLHVDDGSYIGNGVTAIGVQIDAHLHADAERLHVTGIKVKLRQGGEIAGEIALSPWLSPMEGAAKLEATGAAEVRVEGEPAKGGPRPPQVDPFIPYNGTVTSSFKNVSLDTILGMVSVEPYKKFGFDALLNGPAIATFSKGLTKTLVVSAQLAMSPSGESPPGEVATSGVIDGTFTDMDGVVDLRKLELRTASSVFEAHGHLGARPTSSPSSLAVEVHSRNLWDFDTVLRDLGLENNGKIGTAALPVNLAGEFDLTHGSWTGSVIDPHIAGHVQVTDVALDILPADAVQAGQPPSAKSSLVHFDSIEATGSYSASRIVIDRGNLRRGNANIALSGTLTAPLGSIAYAREPLPYFDTNSLLHLDLRATGAGVEDLEPFTGTKLPVVGTLSAQIEADGVVNALNGTGWVELDKGAVWGEPVARIRAQGSISKQKIRLSSVTVSEGAGKIAATGGYDIGSHRFELDAKGTGIDAAHIEWLGKHGLAVTGRLGFAVRGEGTIEDPRLEAHAIMTGLTVGGEPLGELGVTAHTANHSVFYDLTTRLDAAELTAHGQTELRGDYTTQAKIDFSKFNIGAVFKLAQMQDLSGESSLAGTVTVEGPLARLDDLRGEARLESAEVTVAGVHLRSESGLHAELADGLIRLNPIHVTGDQTDLRAQGSLSLKEKQQLDFAASGTINLKIAETMDPDLTASGYTTFQVEAHGPLRNPDLKGRIDFENAALSLEDVPNSLSQLHGSLEFNQNRLEVKSLTAMSGGGLLSVTGFLTYQRGLYFDLTATGSGIRIRYPQGVSSLADATLHLQGPRNNLLLGGDVMITRFTVSPDLDIAGLASQAKAVDAIAAPDSPSSHVRLDVHLTSSPQLNFQNAYAKLAGFVDLRLRGTLASPSLLGRVSITEGNGIIAGTRYELQRGDITFTNPVRIQPNIDLNATARVEDYDITLGLHGTAEKMAITYRSDPPLPEADVLALLALGRTGNQQRLYTQQQEAAGSSPATDALLGGALNATVSSRVQKLFGAGSVKLDPSYLGSLGNSTSRIIVEEQLGRNLTLTYATNVNTTSQQLLQAEVAINRHVSVLVARDESGVFSMVIKATRRFR